MQDLSRWPKCSIAKERVGQPIGRSLQKRRSAGRLRTDHEDAATQQRPKTKKNQIQKSMPRRHPSILPPPPRSAANRFHHFHCTLLTFLPKAEIHSPPLANRKEKFESIGNNFSGVTLPIREVNPNHCGPPGWMNPGHYNLQMNQENQPNTKASGSCFWAYRRVNTILNARFRY